MNRTTRLIMTFLMLSISAFGKIIDVPDGQATIQSGIDAAATGDTVLVQPGVYPENINFNGKQIVIGSLFITTGDTAYVSQTVIDGNQNGSVVTFAAGELQNTVLSGFTLRNGSGSYVDPSPDDELDYWGGGIYCSYASPTLMHLIIDQNTAKFGGGIYGYHSNMVLDSVLISNNYAEGSGGGISFSESNPIITSTKIINNSIAMYGTGGVECFKSTVTLTDVTISNNTGGGAYFLYHHPTLRNVKVSNNSGQGLYFFHSDPNLENVTVNGNRGGGIGFWNSNPSFSTTNRCNIYLNNAIDGADLSAIFSSGILVTVDTFTVINPTEYHVSPLEIFTINILNSKIDQFQSDLYVSPLGSDTNSGLNPSEPLKTITHALSSIQADSLDPHTIFLEAGIYSRSATQEQFPLNMVSFVSLVGSERESTILNAESQNGLLWLSGERGVFVKNLTLTGGSSTGGAAINCRNSNPIISNVNIVENEGGAVSCEASALSITSANIMNNSSSYGGGISCSNGCELIVDSVNVLNNSAYENGGGLYFGSCTASLNNMRIEGNTAGDAGGGIFFDANYELISTIDNVIITGNSASVGGGLYTSSCELNLNHVNIVDNSAPNGAGGFFTSGSNLNIANSILWNDRPRDFHFADWGDSVSVSIAFSNIIGGEKTFELNGKVALHWLAGNIDTNPLFCSPRSQDYTLAENSPCLGAGEDGTNIGRFDVGCGARFQGTTWYVSTSGSDSTGDGSEAYPLASIQNGIYYAKSSDTVLVAPGRYVENINFNGKNLFLGSHFIIDRDTTYISQTIIDGNQTGSVVTFESLEDSNATLIGFTLTNGSAEEGGGVHIFNSAPNLCNLNISGNSTAYLGRGGGLYCFNAAPIISKVLLSDNNARGDGGGLYANNSTLSLINLTISNNTGYYGVGLYSINSQLTMLNSIVWNNEELPIYLNSGSSITVAYSDIQGGAIGLGGNDAVVNWLDGNIDHDPIFVDAERGDFRLQTATPCLDGGRSPCIDTGIELFIWEGDTLIDLSVGDYFGVAPNMGVYEEYGQIADPKIYYVSKSGSNSNVGSENSPFSTIQHAINEAICMDTIRVNPGRYTENINFNGKRIVVESLFRITGDESYIGATIIDGNQIGSVATFRNGENRATILSGFTITNGNGNIFEGFVDPVVREGGGIYIEDASPTLDYLVITENHVATSYIFGFAVSGSGGIECRNASPMIKNTIISNNSAAIDAAIACYYNSNPIMLNSTIVDNISTGTPSGGIGCKYGSNPVLLNTILRDNTSPQVALWYSNDTSSVTIAYSNISGGVEGFDPYSNGIVNWLGGNIDFDPQFYNFVADDYHLRATSPCIDAGVAEFIMNGDTLFSMMAYEYNGPAPDIGAREFDISHTIPEDLSLYQNYPNPFNSQTSIPFGLPEATEVKLSVYNLLGQEVAVLLNHEFFAAGTHIVEVNADGFSSGIYFYQIEAQNLSLTGKMLMVK